MLVVDKPIGLTSHDVVQIIRRGTGIRRAGHTGTLDPRCLGRAGDPDRAGCAPERICLGFGQALPGDDPPGQLDGHLRFGRHHHRQSNRIVDDITEEQFNQVLQRFIGEIEQVPPPYSAVKVQGRRAYEMAREGEEVDLAPRIIKVYSLDILEWAPPEVVVDVYCSSGTYVRSLANDLGKELGTGAHLVGLRRTKSGRFTLRDAVPLRRLQEAFDAGNWYRNLIPAAEALADWPMVELDADQVELIRHGHRIPAEPGQSGLARGVSTQGDLVALLEVDDATQEWQPRKVFFQS